QTVTYTITSKVPQNTHYYSDYAYTYTDTPSARQTVHLDSLKVTVGGSDLNKGKDNNEAEVENGKYTVNI
ncbi:isopeptide-forming domain-containing fimbrial protein, partial [Bifidobacterium pseudocatenulatum]|nr:isopeptide-forming domain-containing fimbrial protein [Bifidobacterium pseudocatenulatum]